MSHVLTFVAPQHHSQLEKKLKQTVDELQLVTRDVVCLNTDIAYDIYVDDIQNHTQQSLSKNLQCDVFIQKNMPENRRKKLFLSDMDATIVQEETLDELAAALNLKEKIAEITAATMRGELNFEQSVKKRVSMLADLPITELDTTFKDINYSTGAKTLLNTLNAHKVHCTLVSGGFTYFTGKVAKHLGFKDNFGNILGIENNKLNGEIIPPIRGKEFKAELLKQKTAELDMSLDQTICAGDGANDADMLTLCQNNNGLGIGFYPKPKLKEQLRNYILYTNLTSLLYAMGYRKDEIDFV